MTGSLEALSGQTEPVPGNAEDNEGDRSIPCSYNPMHGPEDTLKRLSQALEYGKSIRNHTSSRDDSARHQESTSIPEGVLGTDSISGAGFEGQMHRNKPQETKNRQKWLQSLPEEEQSNAKAQRKILQNWQRANRDWEMIKDRMSKRLNRSNSKLVMNRGANYREQLEIYDVLRLPEAKPERNNADDWEINLRDDGTRYVSIGNIFSGLYCPIRERRSLGPSVRRPLDSNIPQSSTFFLNQRKKDQGHSLRTSRYQKKLKELHIHEVAPSSSKQLAVLSVDLFDWASQKPTLPTTLASRSSQALCNDFTHFANALQCEPSSCRPSFLLYNKNERTSVCRPTIHVDQYAHCGTYDRSCLVLENIGVVACQFAWARKHIQYDEGVKDLLTHESVVDEAVRTRRTYVSMMRGIILPQERIQFAFLFQSNEPGQYTEQWGLVLDPPIQHVAQEPDFTVFCHGTAVDYDIPHTKRSRLLQGLEHEMNEQSIRQYVRQLIQTIQYPEKYHGDSLFSLPSYAQFSAANKDFANGMLQFSHEVVDLCQKLYCKAQAIVAKQDDSYTGLEWDLSFNSLEDIVTSADAISQREMDDIAALLNESGTDSDDQDPSSESDSDDQQERRSLREKMIAIPNLEQEYQTLYRRAMFAAHSSDFLERTMREKLMDAASEIPVLEALAQFCPSDTSLTIRKLLAEEVLAKIHMSIEQMMTQNIRMNQQRRRLNGLYMPDAQSYETLFYMTDAQKEAMAMQIHDPFHGETVIAIAFHVNLDLSDYFILQPEMKEGPHAPTLEWRVIENSVYPLAMIPRIVHDAARSIAVLTQNFYAHIRKQCVHQPVRLQILVYSAPSSPQIALKDLVEVLESNELDAHQSLEALLAQNHYVNLELAINVFENALRSVWPEDYDFSLSYCTGAGENKLTSSSSANTVHVVLVDPIASSQDSSEESHALRFQTFHDSIALDSIPNYSECIPYQMASNEHALTARLGPKLAAEWKLWADHMMPSASKKAMAIIGGKNLTSKLGMIDAVMEIASEIFFTGEIANSLYRAFVRHENLKALGSIQKQRSNWRKLSREDEEAEYMLSAIQSLKKKAYREQVRLWLPCDFLIAESSLNIPQESGIAQLLAAYEREKEMEDENPTEAPVHEGFSADPRGFTPYLSYDGEILHTIVRPQGLENEWIQVTDTFISDIKANDINKTGILQEENQEYFNRAYDIGPLSISSLGAMLDQRIGQDVSQSLIINGAFGAAEYIEFSTSTKGMHDILHRLKKRSLSFHIFITGSSTANILHQIEAAQTEIDGAPLISRQNVRDAAILKRILRSQPHAMLTALCSKP